jgi:hypothetical protein
MVIIILLSLWHEKNGNKQKKALVALPSISSPTSSLVQSSAPPALNTDAFCQKLTVVDSTQVPLSNKLNTISHIINTPTTGTHETTIISFKSPTASTRDDVVAAASSTDIFETTSTMTAKISTVVPTVLVLVVLTSL